MVSVIDVREQHAKYTDSSRGIKEAVNDSFDAVVSVFKSAGLPTGMSDEAEELVAAIYHYYEQSR
jgi:hypothetical protein